VKEIFTWLPIFTGSISAVLWLCSACVKVPTVNDPNQYGDYDAEIVVDETNFIATVILQVKWNTWAAATASLTALFQVIGTALSFTPSTTNSGS
jgi:hypothetical protein